MTLAASVARWLAITIAILGVLDPSVTLMRATLADVAIIPGGVADTALARRMAERLDDDYAIVRGPWENAAATVVVGDALPDRIPPGQLFAVRDTNRPAITRFQAPTTSTLDSRLSIPVTARGGAVELRANGMVVDRDSSRSSLTITPTAPGPLLLEAHIAGRDSITVTALTDVIDRPHAVLFFDRRPSWMSTFVRRSLEQDRRFAVASRVITSRNVSTDAGQPPSTLADPAVLELYDVIVVGAPASLTAADVAGLDAFLRRRGGSVVLLYDEVPKPEVHDRLTGATRWTPATLRVSVPGRAEGDSAALRLTEAAWPAALPVAGEIRATAHINGTSRPLVWTGPIGAGQVIVNGALDSWKFRDRSTSGFDEFWRATISRAAREAQDAITIEATPNVLAPGERAIVRVSVRDTLAKPVLLLDSTRVDLWPAERAGEFVARVHAPAEGEHWLRVSASGATAETPIAVRSGLNRVAPNDSATIATLARASGGITGSIDEVERAIRDRVVAERREERWFPMRNGWWILPFAILLGFEWFVRRRRGLA